MFRKYVFAVLFILPIVFFGSDTVVLAQSVDFAWAKQAGGSDSEGVAVDGLGNSIVTGRFEDTATFGNITLTSSGEYDIFIARYDAAGQVLWAKRAGGSAWDGGTSVAVDSSGNSIVTGLFQGTADFGNTTLTSSGDYDIFIAMYDTAGQVLWAKRAGGGAWDEGTSVAVDGSGNSIVTGNFEGTATFGNITLTSSGWSDIFVARYDAAGQVLWAERAGSSAWDGGYNVALDGSGNSIVTGIFQGTANFGNITLTSSGDYDIFVARYDAAGQVLWAERAGGSAWDYGFGLAIDGSGNSIVTGWFQDTADFGSITLTSSGWSDIFVARYDTAGQVLWAERAGSSARDKGTSVAVDGSGNSIVTGLFQGSADFGNITLTSSGDYDIFVAKYDTAGQELWAKRAGGDARDEGNSVAVDGSGNSIVTGYFEGTATFGNITLTSNGWSDIFVAKLVEPSCSLSITSPNGGETWQSPSTHDITWNFTGTSGNVKIQYTTNYGGVFTWSTIVNSTADDGAYSWTIAGGINSNRVRIKISDADDESCNDLSDADFSIMRADTLPDHWNFSANTGNYATVVLPTSANPNIDGSPLANGDYIGIFSQSGLCCGYYQWQGQNVSMNVWGDNSLTSEIDGMQSGELISYRIYRTNEQKEWSIVKTGYSEGTGIYSVDTYMVLNIFKASVAKTLTLNFPQGWNMFSVNINPVNRNVATVMAPIIDKLVIMKNGSGQTYIPEYGINDIGDLNLKEGYQAYMSQAAALNVTGESVDPSTPILCVSGWNMVSYLPTVPMDAAAAFTSISSQLVIAKNNAGQTYIPQYSINDIGDMVPGQGYHIYMSETSTLVYPSGSSHILAKNRGNKHVQTNTESSTTAHFKFTDNTGENATVVVPTDADPKYSDGTPLENGDEIGVFTSAGLCCGATVWEGANKAITVWGNNSQTDSTDGFLAGDTLNFRVWDKDKDVEYLVNVGFREGDPIVYQANGFSVLTGLLSDLTTDVADTDEPFMPENFRLFQNYPNPFNPETTIKYQLPKNSNVTLQILNIKGQLVRTLFDGRQTAGDYYVKWNGKSDYGIPFSSGVYLYRLIVSDNVKVEKMVLIR